MEKRSDLAKKVNKPMGRPKKNLKPEERAKREIANNNERRRMQSINTGISSLRQILRQHKNIQKHSKAAILHQSANYIRKLEQNINQMNEQIRTQKNIIEIYEKQMVNQGDSTDSYECEEERVTTDLPKNNPSLTPNKRLKRSDETSTDKLQGDASDTCSPLSKNQLIVQSSNEKTRILEKEVLEFMSSLEKKRHSTIFKEEPQREIVQPNIKSKPGTCTPVTSASHAVCPENSFPLNHLSCVTSMPTPLIGDVHSNDKPLNLVKPKNSFTESPLECIRFLNKSFGHFRYNSSLDLTSRMVTNPNECLLNAKFNEEGIIENEIQIISGNYGKSEVSPAPHHLQFSNEPRTNSPSLSMKKHLDSRQSMSCFTTSANIYNKTLPFIHNRHYYHRRESRELASKKIFLTPRTHSNSYAQHKRRDSLQEH